MEDSRHALAHARLERPTATSRPYALVQARADDVVVAATLCKPNAAGSYELASVTGFGERQLLKARGAYLAERVILGVTPLHVHAVAVFARGHIARAVGCWAREDVLATPVCAAGDHVEPAWPALLLARRHGRAIAELQVLRHDDGAWRVLALLLHGHTSSDR
jgi:hypothetical protein